jgi:basic membrane protein A
MYKRILTLASILLLLAWALGACAPAATEAPPAAEEKLKVAVAFPGVVSDQSWNEWGYEGLKKAEADCNVEIAYSEDVFQDEQLETFRNYAAQGYDIIIGHGGEYADSIGLVAAEYPDIWFGDTNGLPEGPNVSSMIIGYGQMAYLAGALACEMTESNHIAYVGGRSIPVIEHGAQMFEQAAQTCGRRSMWMSSTPATGRMSARPTKRAPAWWPGVPMSCSTSSTRPTQG